ncbi:MAG: beta-ketoacyl synthase N-terminal-like domain-containing protein, partial [Saprospiraceae bacterium]
QKLITPLIARLQYPIWERALRSSGIAEADIPPIIEKMKKAYVSWNENAFPGLLGNVISGRITNRFDLGGINSVVDAACAASLSAVKMSLSELVEGRADMMITGGVDTDNSPFMYMSFSKTPAFSKSNHITPFDKDADGMLIGEGVGMLVLKRLADAERDGDRIYAVVKGVGTSSDGRFKSIYAPRASGQALAVRRTYEEAGYEPHTVDLLEAHGTGTGGGDPVEFESMSSVFSEGNSTKQHIALGSVKSQVGHTKAAAGAAGMIKTVLALHHKILPPTINVTEPNPKFNIKNTGIYINTEARPWLRDDHPRRASVSAFGFGGINVHIAMEEYAVENEQPYRLHTPHKTVLLQATTPQQLLNICQSHLTNLKNETSAADTLHKITQPQQVSANAARLGFICQDTEDAASLLETAITQLQKNQTAWEHPKGIYFRDRALPTDGKVVALFSGQGSQYVGMGKEIANAFPTLRRSFAQADLEHRFSTCEDAKRLSQTIFPIPVFNNADQKAQQLELTQTQNAQPAIGTLSMGLFKILKNAGLNVDFAAGHSFGELTALWAAGVYDDATFIKLATKRGEVMGTPNTTGDAGTMLAVKANLQQVQQEVQNLEDVKIANINSPTQVILGGSTIAIRNAEQQLKQRGYSVLSLPVAAAFHTKLVAHAQRPFAEFVETQNFSAPQIPVFANATAQPYPNAATAIKKQLQEQILQPVHFQQQIENIYQRGGRVFIEFGPKGVLTNLTKSILANKNDVTAVALNANAKRDSDLQFRQAIVQLQVLGVPLNQVDKYELPKPAPAPKTKLTIGMGGNNYVSPKTQKAYQDVLNNGFKVQTGGTKIVEKIIEKPVIKEVEKIVEIEKIVKVPVEKIVEKIIEVPSQPTIAAFHSTQNQSDMANKEIIQLLQTTVESFQQQQTKTLSVFEQFLKDNHQQTQSLFQLMNEQLQNLQGGTPLPATNGNGKSNGNGNGKSVAVATNGITKNIPPVVDESPVYTNGLQSTTEVNYAAQPQTAVAEAPVSNNAPAGNADKLAEILLAVISDKTGYPAEMLELEMDMEADLGIDSIKRVEIFGAMTEDYPEVSGINPSELAELRTLQQIVDYIAGNASSSAATVAAPNVTATTVTTPTSNTDTAIGNDKLAEILLAVISDKTGYPAEMLELEMDMEADLGIDSIKRVEIFGAMTEDYPEVSGINPSELAELRTLQQIVDYIGKSAKKKH